MKSSRGSNEREKNIERAQYRFNDVGLNERDEYRFKGCLLCMNYGFELLPRTDAVVAWIVCPATIRLK